MNINVDFLIDSSIKLFSVSFLSFIVGIEREFHSHPGGVITYMLVDLGSCLFTMISIFYNEKHDNAGDPMRVAAQIVSGMGFLGSATIYKSKNYVKGINSAASLWICAAIGMGVGSNMIEFSIITSIMTMILLLFNKYYKQRVYKKRKQKNKKLEDEEKIDIYIDIEDDEDDN